MKKKPIYQCSGDEYHLSCCGGCKELEEINQLREEVDNLKGHNGLGEKQMD